MPCFAAIPSVSSCGSSNNIALRFADWNCGYTAPKLLGPQPRIGRAAMTRGVSPHTARRSAMLPELRSVIEQMREKTFATRAGTVVGRALMNQATALDA